MSDFWILVNKIKAVLFFSGGLIMLGIILIGLIMGTPSEDKLKLVEGVPSQSKLFYSRKEQNVQFKVADILTQYSQNEPHFAEVVAVSKSEKPVKLWVEEKGDWGALYKLAQDDQTIVSYAESVKSKESSKKFATIFGGIIGLILTIVGASGLFGKGKNKA